MSDVRSEPTSTGPRRDAASGERDAGFAGGFGGLLFGLLFLGVGTLLVASAWGVLDTKFAADAAARQAVRTYVEAPDASAAATRAEEAADASLAGYGRDPSKAVVTLVAGRFARCARVTIQVSYPAPVVVVPWVGEVATGGTVSARHSELVDPFRTGLAGTSSCA